MTYETLDKIKQLRKKISTLWNLTLYNVINKVTTILYKQFCWSSWKFKYN